MDKYIIVWADFGAPGIWILNPTVEHPYSVLAIDHESIGMSIELSQKFNNWIKSYWIVYDNPEEFNYEEFNKIGAMLAAELQQFLGEPYLGNPLVLFRPELLRSVEEYKKHYRGNNE